MNGVDACGSTSLEQYISYNPSFGYKTVLRKAVGTSHFSDSPAYWYSTVKWSLDKSIVLKEEYTAGTSTQKYCFSDGVYKTMWTPKKTYNEDPDY